MSDINIKIEAMIESLERGLLLCKNAPDEKILAGNALAMMTVIATDILPILKDINKRDLYWDQDGCEHLWSVVTNSCVHCNFKLAVSVSSDPIVTEQEIRSLIRKLGKD